MKKYSDTIRDILITLATALAISLVMAVFQPKPFFTAWFGSWLLLWLSLFLLVKVWRHFGGGKTLATLMLVAFFARVFLGLFIYTSLPNIGFGTPVELGGYAYSDAFRRDNRAIEWAASKSPLILIFQDDLLEDQYGGLLFVSASVYRIFGLNSPRPMMITILAALTMTAGLAFLHDAIKRRWGVKAALAAAWFYALYPEGLLLGSVQMREPFLIGLFSIAFWAVVTWREKTGLKLLYFLLSMAVAISFSIPYGSILLAILFIFGLIEFLSTQKSSTIKDIGYLMLAVVGVAAISIGWMWVKPTFYYDAYLTRINSGNINAILNSLGDEWHYPFITIYGITQPFLPGALTDESLPFWRATAIIRALGWWFTLPFIFYGLFAVWKAKPRSDRWGLVFITLTLIAWIVISSLRGGGDLWDNPRYRALLIPWLALLVGWCWQRIRQGNYAWFLRWASVVFIFFIVFLLWYFRRYHIIMHYIGFNDMVKVIVASTAVILGSGVVWEGYKWYKGRKPTKPSDV